jgi:hypothetical protein
LPPPLITTYHDPQQQTNVIEEIKLLALKGYEVYSCILEKLCSFGTDSDGEIVALFMWGSECCHFCCVGHFLWFLCLSFGMSYAA